jgi:hypothetical protein
VSVTALGMFPAGRGSAALVTPGGTKIPLGLVRADADGKAVAVFALREPCIPALTGSHTVEVSSYPQGLIDDVESVTPADVASGVPDAIFRMGEFITGSLSTYTATTTVTL